jgi:hypothetical protein
MRRGSWAAGALVLAVAAVCLTVAGHHRAGHSRSPAPARVAGHTAARSAHRVTPRPVACPAYTGVGWLTACVDVHLTGPLTLTGRVRSYLPVGPDAPAPRTCREYAKGFPSEYAGLMIAFPNLLDPRVPYYAHDAHGRPVNNATMDDLHGHRRLHGHFLFQLGSIGGYHGPGTYTTYYQATTTLDGRFYNTAYARALSATVTAGGGGHLHATGMPRLVVDRNGQKRSFAAGPPLDLDLDWTCTGQEPTPAAEAAHGRYRQR